MSDPEKKDTHRLPSGSHALRVYSGDEWFIYQIVEPGDKDDGNPQVIIYNGQHGVWFPRLYTLQRSWTRGSSRALADALASEARCKHCGFSYEMKHQDEHKGLCCGCLDLSCGMPLKQLNEERAGQGLPLITKPWPVRA